MPHTAKTHPFLHFRADEDVRQIVENATKRFGTRSAFIRYAIKSYRPDVAVR